MRLESLRAIDELEALLRLLERLKHDLGKYIALQARWLPPDSEANERRDAVIADVFHTRRGPEGSASAQVVWAPFAEVLGGRAPLDGHRVQLGDDPDVDAIGGALRALAAMGEAEVAASWSPAEVDAAMQRCRDVADRCRSLVRRARAHRDELRNHDEEG